MDDINERIIDALVTRRQLLVINYTFLSSNSFNERLDDLLPPFLLPPRYVGVGDGAQYFHDFRGRLFVWRDGDHKRMARILGGARGICSI